MKIQVSAIEDESFKVFGTSAIETSEFGKIEKEEVQKEEPLVEVQPEVIHYPAPKPAPIENQRGLDWFNGTSWGNN
jgi:hypothetical protein